MIFVVLLGVEMVLEIADCFYVWEEVVDESVVWGGQFDLLLFGWFYLWLLGFGDWVQFFQISQDEEFYVTKEVLSSFLESNIYDHITAF